MASYPSADRGSAPGGCAKAFVLEGARVSAERGRAYQADEALRADVISQQLIAHLMDAHASEEQSLGLLRRARRSCSREGLLDVHDEHLGRAERHRRLLEDRLDAHGAKPSALKDAAMRLGALNLSSVFQAQPATPGKATALLFALTHSKMAGYELLRSVARRASDAATVEVTERMLADERESAARLSASFDEAVEAGIDSPDPSGNALGDLRRTLGGRAERTRLGSVSGVSDAGACS